MNCPLCNDHAYVVEMGHATACLACSLSLPPEDFARLAGLKAENKRLRSALIEQQEIWESAAPILNMVDRQSFTAPFMDFHDPIGRARAALGGDQ